MEEEEEEKEEEEEEEGEDEEEEEEEEEEVGEADGRKGRVRGGGRRMVWSEQRRENTYLRTVVEKEWKMLVPWR